MAAFVVFVECLADVGGSREPVPVPTPAIHSTPQRAPRDRLLFEFEDEFSVVVADQGALVVVGNPGLLGAPA